MAQARRNVATSTPPRIETYLTLRLGEWRNFWMAPHYKRWRRCRRRHYDTLQLQQYCNYT